MRFKNKGKGRQCFIKTEFALLKKQTELGFYSTGRTRKPFKSYKYEKLIRRINDSENKQIFIATHSNLISTRLNLRNTILLNSNSNINTGLKSLKEDTANFFIKAPDNNILEYILSPSNSS